MKKAEQPIVLPDFDFRIIEVNVKGVTPLIMNHFSEKSRNTMIGVVTGGGKKGREVKNPEALYNASIYYMPNGKDAGFPAVGFKAAMTRGAKQLGMAMTDARGAFHVLADEGDLVRIYGAHRMRDDIVRNANGGTDVRFRAEFPEWTAKIKIKYNACRVSAEQVVSILAISGFACGIGEWRPEKSNSGSFGMFEVV